jgi:hypothetical protein
MARVAAACAWVSIASTFAMPILAVGRHIELPAATEGSAVARFRLAGSEIDASKGEFAADLARWFYLIGGSCTVAARSSRVTRNTPVSSL